MVRKVDFLRIPLHDPPLTWAPFVRVLPVQKLMKLAGSLGGVSRCHWREG